MKGACLCNGVRFRTHGDTPNFYQCHCSLCRKQGGASSNAATFVLEENFSWEVGQEQVSGFTRESGFTSHFCSVCGSPVPNLLRDTGFYWIPAGLLEPEPGQTVVAHIYTASKADWESLSPRGQHFAEMPDFETMFQLLHQCL